MQAMPLGIDRLIFVPCGSGYEIDMPRLVAPYFLWGQAVLISLRMITNQAAARAAGSLKYGVNWGRNQAGAELAYRRKLYAKPG